MSAQYGQDRAVLELLGGHRGGFFLDSGASNGRDASNTWLLEDRYGWDGICVEPDPRFFRELVGHRRCRCVNCCLYTVDGTVDFVAAGTIGGILTEYDPSMLRHARAAVGCAPDGPVASVKRPARTASSILRDCGAPPVIDYWSLDTEGSELAILRSFPFDRYRVRVLTVEHNWLPVRAEIRAVLEARAYRWVGELGCDDCYVLTGESPAPPGWRSHAWRRRTGRTATRSRRSG